MKYKEESLHLELAGVRHYTHNGNTLFKEGEQVLLFHDTDNQFDPNAIKVMNLRGQHIGYIPKNWAEEIGYDLENEYYYEVIINNVIDDLLYPKAFIELTKHTDINPDT